MHEAELMRIVLVTHVGAATGSLAAAAAFACAASERDRPALLVDLAGGPRPRPSLLATAAAQALEERIAGHVTGASVASRGQLCQLSLPADRLGVEQAGAAIAICPDAFGVVHVAPDKLQLVIECSTQRPDGVLLRADLERDRALSALAAGALMQGGLRVAILKAPLGWIAARCALAGLPLGAPCYGLPPRLCTRLLHQG
jgi:hypothetical protein